MSEQAVIADFEYVGEDLDALYEVEDRLVEAIEAAEVGVFDGNEMAVDLTNGTLYMYGPDAEALFAVVRPILADAGCLRKTRVTIRAGLPGEDAPERVEQLDG